MWKFILLTFAVLGVMFYDLSGGADFVPEAPPREAVAEAPPAPEVTAEDILASVNDETPQGDIVVRDNGTVTLASAPDPGASGIDGVAARLAQPVISADAGPSVGFASLSVSPDGAPVAAGADIVETGAAPPAVEAGPDFRSVEVAALNVRSGPSTSDEVIGRLEQFEIVSVLEETEDGWSRILIEGDGIEGWVASRFLGQ